MTAIHVATVPPGLDLTILDTVLGGLESALLDLGAARVWIATDRPGLMVMAELPDTSVEQAAPVQPA